MDSIQSFFEPVHNVRSIFMFYSFTVFRRRAYISEVRSDVMSSYDCSSRGHGEVTSEDVEGGGLSGS